MDERVERALERGHTIDITTTGRRTGQPRRIEIVFHNFDGRLYITGVPGERYWYANLVADPRFVFHLKGAVKADLPATAVPITDETARRAVLERVVRVWKGQDLEEMVASAPLVEVVLERRAA